MCCMLLHSMRLIIHYSISEYRLEIYIIYIFSDKLNILFCISCLAKQLLHHNHKFLNNSYFSYYLFQFYNLTIQFGSE